MQSGPLSILTLIFLICGHSNVPHPIQFLTLYFSWQWPYKKRLWIDEHFIQFFHALPIELDSYIGSSICNIRFKIQKPLLLILPFFHLIIFQYIFLAVGVLWIQIIHAYDMRTSKSSSPLHCCQIYLSWNWVRPNTFRRYYSSSTQESGIWNSFSCWNGQFLILPKSSR